jgi:dihydropyrimidinase
MKKHGAMLHAITRPNYIEAEAIERAVHFCKVTGGQLYIVHMSTAEGADILRRAQAEGVPVVAETCIQYLTMDDSWFKKKDGHLYACCPQIKTPKDIERLWEGLETGEVSVISTDTCSFTRKQKAMWKGDFTKIPMGMPGLETLLPAAYTEGVLGRKMPIEDLMVNLSTNPAKLMGLYPKKGHIRIGSDADIAIIHPTKKIEVDYKKMETNADWNPFQGQELAGFSRTTLSRGEVIVDNYKVVGKEGRGQWLPRKTAGWYYEEPAARNGNGAKHGKKALASV